MKKQPFQVKSCFFGGSRRRIRTLTNRVRVCRATFTQFGYLAGISETDKNYYIYIITKSQAFIQKNSNKNLSQYFSTA